MTARNAAFLAITLAVVSSSSESFGAVTLPDWYGDPNTTSQIFLFNTGNPNPTADISVNPYGTATGVVDVGFFGNGWENPAAPPSNPGHEADGAWDVGAGDDGSITLSIPVAATVPPPGQSYKIDVQVFAIVYKDLQKIPELSIGGVTPGNISLLESGILSTRAPNGSWEYRTWSAVIDSSSSSAITVALTPPSGAVSVIDRFEVYTRYTLVPEPSVAMLAGLAASSLLTRRRR